MVEKAVLLIGAAGTFIGVFVPIVTALISRGKPKPKPDPEEAHAVTPIMGMTVPSVNLTVEFVAHLQGALSRAESRAEHQERRADAYEAALRDAGLPVPEVAAPVGSS